MRGKAFVRMNAPGMQISGPRPSSHSGAPVVSAWPTNVGLSLQVNFAVPNSDMPSGAHRTARICSGNWGELLFLKTTTRSPLGSTIGSEPWLSSHLGVVGIAAEHSVVLNPLISSGVDHVF